MDDSIPNMIEHIRVLAKYRELLWVWVLRGIKVRYKQSLLGGAWAVLQPLLLTVIFSIVFTYLVRVSTDGIPYPIFSYSGLLLWTFFATSINLAASSLVQNMNLVTKIYFPREIIPIAVVAGSFFDLLVASAVFIGMMVFYKVPLTLTILILPVIIAPMMLLTMGIAMITASVNVFYRDVRFVVPLMLQVWMYATPIIYPISVVPDSFQKYYIVNPIAGLIDSFRAITIRGQWPNWTFLLVAVVMSIVIFGIGYMYIKRVEWQFADLI